MENKAYDDEWKVYNYGMITTKMPHENKNVEKISHTNKWKSSKTLFARWTSNFDCGFETEWWYCLKDDKFDISTLKSKRRYVINKGINNFYLKIINPKEYLNEMYGVYINSLEDYPEKYRSTDSKEDFIKQHENSKRIYIGVWDKESNIFSGYVICEKIQNKIDTVIDLQAVYVKKEALKKEINAAIGNFVCCKFLNEENVKYIYDGERNIRHITNYQDYLIKYFGFKKVYCKLNIKYKPIMNFIIFLLYPFRNFIKNTNNKLLYNIYCVLFQEQIRRSFKEKI